MNRLLSLSEPLLRHLPIFGKLGVLLLFFACKDQQEQIPAYVTIQPFVVNAEGGAAWQKIEYGWLYVNNEFLGGYSLPSTVPVLAAGESNIVVFPGVKENGITNTPSVYPFLVKYTTKSILEPGQTSAVQPVTAYDPDTKFAWALDRSTFDGGSSVVLQDRDGDSSTVFKISTAGGFSGKGVVLEVDTAHRFMEVSTEKAFLPIKAERETWLEMHYKNDIPFYLSLVGANTLGSEEFFPVFEFNTSANGGWNKIYINLTQTLVSSKLEKHGLYFRVLLSKDGSGKYPQTKGTVLLDNIRIMHY